MSDLVGNPENRFCHKEAHLSFIISDKKTPIKRKRGSLSIESSLSPGLMTTPKTPGNLSQKVPLSERQQLAMIMRMSDECQGAAVTTDQGQFSFCQLFFSGFTCYMQYKATFKGYKNDKF